MENNKPIMVVCGKSKQSTILENLAVIRSVLYTGIVALWFAGAVNAYAESRNKPIIFAMKKSATTVE